MRGWIAAAVFMTLAGCDDGRAQIEKELLDAEVGVDAVGDTAVGVDADSGEVEVLAPPFEGACRLVCDIDSNLDLVAVFEPVRLDISIEGEVSGEYIAVSFEYALSGSYIDDDGEEIGIWAYWMEFMCEEIRHHFTSDGVLLSDRVVVVVWVFDESGTGFFVELLHENCRPPDGVCTETCWLEQWESTE